MKLSNKEFLEIAGAIALVGSLAFVGLQLKLDRDVALAQSFSDGIESRKEDIRAKMESESYMLMLETLWESGQRPQWWLNVSESYESKTLNSGAQIMARFFEVELDYLELENLYFRFEQGLIDENHWLGAEQLLSSFLTDPFRRAVFLNRRSGLSETVNELVAVIDSASET
ncbi:MAG: hypothetical protein COB20_15485 [SAR86 cluster bacterium]|uniref:Uncharacterized protein n=1 Tax=SAR86 cluster bacterium TaxID=2030880 RepID=A0A2A4WW24_9GAMM|nr:MAG: hypothetical protein COB20_15485 [SAR86 cluster bacterium]